MRRLELFVCLCAASENECVIVCGMGTEERRERGRVVPRVMIDGSGARGKQSPNKALDRLRRGRWSLCLAPASTPTPIHPPCPGGCVPYFHALTTPTYPSFPPHSHQLTPPQFRQTGANTPLRIHLQTLEVQVPVSPARLAFSEFFCTPYGPTAVQKVEEGRKG